MAVRYNSKIITDGLVLCLDAANRKSYPTTGTTWTDLSGRGNTGTLVNGVGYNGSNGGSLVFDGVNDYISCNTYNFGNEITVFCFIKPSTISTIQTIFVNSTTGSNTNGIRLFFNTFANNDRTIRIELGNGSASTSVATSSKIVYDIWQQIAFVFSKNTAIGSIYYNGDLAATSALGIVNYNTSAAFRIGRFIDNAFPYKGNISQVSIYNRALSAAEVKQNYNATKSRYGL